MATSRICRVFMTYILAFILQVPGALQVQSLTYTSQQECRTKLLRLQTLPGILVLKGSCKKEKNTNG